MLRLPPLALLPLAASCFQPAPLGGPETPDASVNGPAQVRVLTYSWRTIGEQILEAPVLVHDADGKLVERVTSGVGSVSVQVPPGGSVTVFERGTDLTTYVGVEDGDVLVVGSGGTVAPNRGAVVQLSAGPAGTDRYRVHGRCVSGVGADPAQLRIVIRGLCGVGPRDMLAIAEMADSPRHYLFQAGVNLVPDTANTIAGAWREIPSFAISISGLAATQSTSVTLGVRSRDRLVWAGDHALPAATSGTSSLTARHPDAGDGSYLGYSTVAPDGNGQSSYQMVPRVNEFVASIAEHPLHQPVQLTANRGRISWSVAERMRAPDLIYASMIAMSGNQAGAVWRFILPAQATHAVVPTLPADLADVWRPTSIRAEVILYEMSTVDAAGFRQQINASIGSFTNSPTPATFHATFSSGSFSP